jgi:hypothetical protein
MDRTRVLVALGVLAIAGAGSPAGAANSPTFRDCSAFIPGFDPDFVQLSNVMVNSDGSLVVLRSQNQVPLVASESSDPGDSGGHVTLTATVTAPAGIPTQTVSREGTGRVVLVLPLIGSGVGHTYAISWSATFDNGMHACPSTVTPENTPADPHPFVVTVVSSS